MLSNQEDKREELTRGFRQTDLVRAILRSMIHYLMKFLDESQVDDFVSHLLFINGDEIHQTIEMVAKRDGVTIDKVTPDRMRALFESCSSEEINDVKIELNALFLTCSI